MSSPILIGGTGRSGTTLLARLIGEHPAIFSFRWETQFIVSPGGLVDVIGSDYGEEQLQIFLTNLRGRWFRRVMRANTPRQYEAGLCDDITESELRSSIEAFLKTIDVVGPSLAPAQELIESIARPAVKRSGATRWSEKTPRNVLYADTLQRILPGMRMIHIIRDGRDVATSMAANGFWPIGASKDIPELRAFSGDVTPPKAALYWKRVLELGRLRAAKLREGTYLELRYEDLVTAPRATVRLICDFLEEEYRPEILRAIDMRPESIGRWKVDLTSEQRSEIHRAIGPELRNEGYDV